MQTHPTGGGMKRKMKHSHSQPPPTYAFPPYPTAPVEWYSPHHHASNKRRKSSSGAAMPAPRAANTSSEM